MNPSDATLPSNWIKGNWGTNTAIFTCPVTGQDGARSARVQITGYASGDAKWAFSHISVTPGTAYQFSDYYQSDATTELVIEYKSTSNVLSYVSLGTLPMSAAWTSVTKTFTVPAGMQSATVFHLVRSIGTLSIDNVALSSGSAIGGTGSGTTTPPTNNPPLSNTAGNLISNPSAEAASSMSAVLPLDWDIDSWGTNTPTFSYPVAGQDGAK